MTRVWCLAIVLLLFGCSSPPINRSTFVATPPLWRQEVPIEPPKTETKQDAAPVRPTFNGRYMPLTMRASFSIGGVTSWTPGLTRITYTDQVDEISELGCRDLRPDCAPSHRAISGGKSDVPADRSYRGLCTGMRDLRDCYAYCCRFLDTARLPAHRRSGQRGPG